jgi:hypothetical protein
MRPKGLYLDGRPRTFKPMYSGRGLRLLVLALVVALGLAGGAQRAPGAASPVTTASISAPRQSLPVPVHDEATCAFCQAAIFPPCAPAPAAASVGQHSIVRRAVAASEARAPHATSHRAASSRAPPVLRTV